LQEIGVAIISRIACGTPNLSLKKTTRNLILKLEIAFFDHRFTSNRRVKRNSGFPSVIFKISHEAGGSSLAGTDIGLGQTLGPVSRENKPVPEPMFC
jgi:hypothetical protein